MKTVLKAGVATGVLALAMTMTTETFAADLGSIKDGYAAAPAYVASAAGPCYFRGDVGYSASQDPSVTWPVNNLTRTFADQAAHDDYYNNGNTAGLISETTTFAGDAVSNVSLENTWLAEGGFGCGSGSRGFRSEIMLGYRGDRKLDGEPHEFTVTDVIGGVNEPPVDMVDPLHTSIQTYTLMLNVYKDLGNYNRFVPYIGAGIGLAIHDVDEAYFTGNPNLVNRIEGDRDVSFAWALMAGVGYQISDRAILDVGYRYIDMGSAQTGRVDSAGFVNPAVRIDDIAAHEVKVGLRYHFGDSGAEYAPFK